MQCDAAVLGSVRRLELARVLVSPVSELGVTGSSIAMSIAISSASRRKLQRRQLALRDPAHFLAEHRPRFAEQLAPEEMQLHDAFGVFVRDVVDFGADSDRWRRVPRLSPAEASCERFVVVALAAGELPEAGEVRPVEAPGHQKSTVALDDGGGHDDPRRRRPTISAAWSARVPG